MLNKKVNVNVSKNIYKLYTAYGRDNTKQAEMPYFHRGPSRQEKFLIRLDQNGKKLNCAGKKLDCFFSSSNIDKIIFF